MKSKVPLIKQHDEKDCAAASLCMLLAYYGKRVSLVSAREAVQVDMYGLPWDHLDYGVSRKFLELENKRAHQNVTTPHCRIRCAGCGANKLNGGHCDARPKVARDTTAV